MAIQKSEQRILNENEIPLGGLEEAPEIYVDGYFGAHARHGVVKINFFTITFDPQSNKMTRKVAFTMVSPITTVVAINNALSGLVESFKKDGLLVEAEPISEKSNA